MSGLPAAIPLALLVRKDFPADDVKQTMRYWKPVSEEVLDAMPVWDWADIYNFGKASGSGSVKKKG